MPKRPGEITLCVCCLRSQRDIGPIYAKMAWGDHSVRVLPSESKRYRPDICQNGLGRSLCACVAFRVKEISAQYMPKRHGEITLCVCCLQSQRDIGPIYAKTAWGDHSVRVLPSESKRYRPDICQNGLGRTLCACVAFEVKEISARYMPKRPGENTLCVCCLRSQRDIGPIYAKTAWGDHSVHVLPSESKRYRPNSLGRSLCACVAFRVKEISARYMPKRPGEITLCVCCLQSQRDIGPIYAKTAWGDHSVRVLPSESKRYRPDICQNSLGRSLCACVAFRVKEISAQYMPKRHGEITLCMCCLRSQRDIGPIYAKTAWGDHSMRVYL